ncbi:MULTISPECIES: SagB family peptide dehydrogenase [unclassified Pseudomonas]|uniref:SagB family peptide dehydrogenase n=1 Tax=unclassified Pseudomonas TaxID=196821 RepID=UPI002AC98A5F|nr:MULTISPECIES: SagB family peptide dehydrogenase [unclassified Pseudomonas]MEB0044007.1 SagB family peptide dehydrogenase [Pseudomonas sp. Dout3]MEB0095055.1 SagB family peptide dehydrogenase [Pseudomonas sp. DC1.2]WPX58619.1 SagB family peptide dehydrogenase [Pseudomonas sp. DC1.2]
MYINPHLFILPRTPSQIVWDYKNHKQFELNLEYTNRLAQLTCNPALFDNNNTIDTQFFNTGILTTSMPDTVEWGWDELSKIFHIGTKNIPCEHIPENIHEWSRDYLDHCNEVLASPAPNARLARHSASELIALPAPCELPACHLVDALFRRKTCRTFTGEAMSLRDISTLLYLSLGYLKERENDVDDAVAAGLGARRSSPSGGGLNACEGFLYVQNVNCLEPGLYAYHPAEHALSFVNPLPGSPLGQLLCGQHFINDLPAGLFISARFDKLWWKYEHSRAYRMAYVEAGHISQTFQLVATALGMSTWLTGALADDQVETLLQLDHSAEQPLFFVGCGQSNGQVMCEELKILMNRQGVQP